jgi:hypothetical protein
VLFATVIVPWLWADGFWILKENSGDECHVEGVMSLEPHCVYLGAEHINLSDSTGTSRESFVDHSSSEV